MKQQIFIALLALVALYFYIAIYQVEDKNRKLLFIALIITAIVVIAQQIYEIYY